MRLAVAIKKLTSSVVLSSSSFLQNPVYLFNLKKILTVTNYCESEAMFRELKCGRSDSKNWSSILKTFLMLKREAKFSYKTYQNIGISEYGAIPTFFHSVFTLMLEEVKYNRLAQQRNNCEPRTKQNSLNHFYDL